MKLRSKLFLAQVPLGIALIMLCIFTAATLRSIITNANVDVNNESITDIHEMEHVLEEVKDQAMFVVFSHGTADTKKFELLRASFDRHLAEQEHNAQETQERALIQKIAENWKSYQQALEKIFQDSSSPTIAQRFINDETLFKSLREKVSALFSGHQTAIYNKSSDISRHAQSRLSLTLWGSVLALLCGAIATSIFTRKALYPLSKLGVAVQQLSQGNLEIRAPMIGKDEISQLAQQINQLAERLLEYRKSSLGDLLQAQQASQAAIDSLNDPVLILGANGQILNVNRSAENTLEIFSSDSPDPLKSLGPLMSSVLLRVCNHVLGGKGPYIPGGLEEAVQLRLIDGEHYFLPRANPIYDDKGIISGATIVLQDVTQLHRFDQLKSNLIATLAKELRTPLISLRLALHICLEETAGSLTEKQLELLQGAREDGEQLQSIVEELLELSHLESGRIELDITLLSTKHLVDALVDSHQQLADQYHMEIIIQNEVPSTELSIDKEKVKSVFSALLEYMIQQTKSPLFVKVYQDIKNHELTYFELQSPACSEFAEPIEEFLEKPTHRNGAAHQTENFLTAKQLIRAHGGDIGVMTTQGCSLWFTLPSSGNNNSA